MGTLRSTTDHSGMLINGIRLGEPARDQDNNGKPLGQYRWDHGSFPNAAIDQKGIITLDDTDII